MFLNQVSNINPLTNPSIYGLLDIMYTLLSIAKSPVNTGLGGIRYFKKQAVWVKPGGLFSLRNVCSEMEVSVLL